MQKRKRKFIGALLTSAFSPASLSNLISWYTDDIVVIDAFNNRLWRDNIDPANNALYPLAAGGAFNPVTQLNGIDVLGNLPGANVNEYGNDGNPYATIPVMEQNNISFTGLFLINQTGNNNQMCHRQRGNNQTDFLFRALATNKLEFFSRSDNGQTILLPSVTDFNGAGWNIVAITFDFPTRTSRLIENGNIISGQNLAMNTFSYLFSSAQGVYLLCDNGALGAQWKGGLGEFFYYTGVKTNGEINLLGNYLASKFALTWTNI